MSLPKTFSAGERLFASDLNDNFEDLDTRVDAADAQGVRAFADASARDTAIPSPTEGMVAWIDDDDELLAYDGSDWVGVGGGLVATGYVLSPSFSTASTSFVDVTSARITITPSDAGNDIYLFAFTVAAKVNGGSFPSAYFLQLRRDSTTDLLPADAVATIGADGFDNPQALVFRDQPSTTSAVQYDVRARTAAGTFSTSGVVLLVMEVKV